MKRKTVFKRILACCLAVILMLTSVPLSAFVGLDLSKISEMFATRVSAFSARTTMPTSDNAYYYANNPFYKSGYGLPNCTCYAFGRAWEVTGKYPKLSTGNAGEWYAYNRSKNYYPYGTTPKAGSIACWSGHVAFVESVNSNGTINFSESNWSGRKDPAKKFRYQTNKNPYSYTSGFQGYIYVVDGGGGSDATAPIISNVKVTDVSTNGYTITCNVTDNVGIARVSFPTWTKENDQDDIIWRDGTIFGNTVTFRVNASEHNNELGWYATHIYAYDTSGNYSFVERLIYLENTKPIISNIKITDRNNTGYTVTCNVSDNVGIARVAFPTWTLKKDQDDIIWKDGSVSGNTATFRVNISDHNNELGVYVTHIYAYDACGNYSASAITADMVINAASTTYKGNKYTLFESNVNWNEAKRICESYGGHLVTITSAEENSVVKSLASKAKNNVWYGATDKETEGVWKWITEEAFTFSDWATGEPNNLDNQDYLQLLSKNQWDDVQECELTYQSFICEIEHTHTVIIESETSANCAKTGYTGDKICDKCGVVIKKGTVIPATGNHSFGEWKQIKVATCTTKGEKIRTCSVCGKTETLSIDMLPHSYTSKVTKSPTCIATGVKTYTCSCGESYSEIIPKVAHDYSSKTATSAYLKSTATCTSAAVYYYKCANCSEKSTDTYKYGSALGHTGGTANCIDKAVCTRCNTAYGLVNLSNHKSVVKDSAVAATCTKTGLTEGKHCSACGKTITAQTVIPAKGHTESDWISDANGAKHTECTVCHVALSTKNCEHAETKNAVTNPTCIKPGSIITVCELCGEKLDEKKIAPLGHKISTTVTPATLSKNGKNVQKCSVCGETVNTTEICRISKTALSKTSYTYNGKVQKPAVSVKDSAGKALKIGTDYTVEYSGGCQSSGTYTVTVKFKGNYSGTQKLTYRIVLNAPAELKATRQKASYITLSWSKVSGATGYSVYQYNAKTKKYEKVASSKGNTATVKNLKAGKSYSFKVVALGKDNSLNSAFSKKITVGTSPVAPVLKAKSATKTAGLIWKKISGANSYTVYYSTKKNGTYKKLKTVKGNSYTAKKPIAGKTYYYKVVATAKIAGRTLTSGYSNIVKG